MPSDEYVSLGIRDGQLIRHVMSKEDVERFNDSFAREHDINDYYARSGFVIGFIEKRRLKIIKRLMDAKPGERILEVGCGEGRLATELLARGAKRPERFVATDVSLERRDAAADAAIDFREASVYELPFERDAFDLVVCCEVLEHLEDPRRALREIGRVARRIWAIAMRDRYQASERSQKDLCVPAIPGSAPRFQAAAQARA